jgi:Questin oxidase-like
MLKQLLTDSLRFAPLYGSQGKLFTHLPMALFALERMGASDERLVEFARKAAAKLVLKQPCESLGQAQWRLHLGQARYYAGYEALFADWMAREGLLAVLQQALPVLMPGVGSAAFHALIRLAYALQSRHETEIVAALASWAATFETLHVFEETALRNDEISIVEVMHAARKRADLCMPENKHDFIVQRMRVASSLSAFGELVSAAKACKPSLRDMAESSLAIYRDSYNFTALHMLTATHAARVLCEYVPSMQSLLMQYLLPAWLAAWVAIERPPIELRLAYETDDVATNWMKLLDSGVNAEDEHDIKITFSAWQEYLHYGFAGYAKACAHVMRERVC